MINSRLSAIRPRFLSDRTMRSFLGIALAACAVDLLTKEIAVRALGEDGWYTISERLSLTLVWNTGVTGGSSLGPLTWLFNVAITVLALGLIVTVVRAMAGADRRSTLALGLVSGGALGNLASIVAGPEGVADFLAVRMSDDLTIVANVADLFLWSGALALVPVIATIVRMVRAERATRTVRGVAVEAELA